MLGVAINNAGNICGNGNYAPRWCTKRVLLQWHNGNKLVRNPARCVRGRGAARQRINKQQPGNRYSYCRHKLVICMLSSGIQSMDCSR